MITAEVLLERIRNLGSLNTSKNEGNDDATLLSYIGEELDSKIVPQIIRQREEYLVVSSRVTLVTNQTKYRIPYRAFGQRLRDVGYVDADGNELNFGASPLSREELQRYGDIATSNNLPLGWFIEGPYVQLVPTSGTYTGWIEFTYYLRPSKLVLSTAVRRIVTVSLTTGVCTLDSAVPSTWNSTLLYDIQTYLPGGELKVFDAVASQVGGGGLETQITFTTALDGTGFGTFPVEVGDYVCLASECAQVMIPEDLLPQLAEAVVTRALYSGRDQKALAAGMARVREGIKENMSIQGKRVEGPEKIPLRGTPLFPRG